MEIDCQKCLKGYIKTGPLRCTLCKEVCGTFSTCDGTDKCITCRSGLTGEFCNICSEGMFMRKYLTSRICQACEDSPCTECNGTEFCVSCPEGIEGPTCNRCTNNLKGFVTRGKCIPCSESPCAPDGICDGTNICTCEDYYCCGVYDGYYYEVASNTCRLCNIYGCGKCDSSTEIDCTFCLNGLMPSGNLVDSCKQKELANYQFSNVNYF